MKKIILLVLLLVSFNSYSQQIINQQRPVQIDSKIKSDAVSLLSKQIKDNYVFPDIADKLAYLIESNLKNGAYENVNEAGEFSRALTKDLQSVSNDKHLHVNLMPALASELKDGVPDKDETHRRKFEQPLEKENYGFRKMEILPGNIGYLDLRTFVTVDIAKQTAVSAMGFFANADALIFDLRNNNGGDPNMVQFLCSYLFDSKPVHLNDIYNRPENKTEEFWTLEKIPGKRLPNVPVYILTSKFAFSGAEEFAYDLQSLKRAKTVGEATGGGANPNMAYRLNDYMVSFIPTGRAINPITKTNWEGVGVKPDIPCKESDALNVAKLEIMKTLLSKAGSDEERDDIQWQIEIMQALANPVDVSEGTLQKYAGDYEPRKIYFENGKLVYERPGVLAKTLLIPITNTMFMLQGREDFRIQFNTDASGNVVSLTGIYQKGPHEENKKVN